MTYSIFNIRVVTYTILVDTPPARLMSILIKEESKRNILTKGAHLCQT